jgi:hypothetical protein
MDVRINSKDGPSVLAPTQVVERLTKQLQVDQQKWLRQLAEEPSRFGDLEVSIHQAFQQLADQLVASLLAEATHQSPALEAGKKK